ncbi:methyltransferase [Endozoicomonas sp. Mp262]|uniref:tRNA1(Val) (adenine(37)-N6)-methyltransferase n=1 Tax=Endozoicomonas sp. Mp262 TaxID=2919499 RepID=UPI0021D975F6
MAKNSYFQFKQFRIEQGQCAMKVTTDACLLGAITEVENTGSILDIGAGTGLLSLMAAQRSQANITAVELDPQACQQASENFDNSPWPNQLTVINSTIQDFAATATQRFDCIICNPPFFHNCYKASEKRRSQARHTDTLTFEELASAISKLLRDTGLAWVMLPVDFSHLFAEAANRYGLKPNKIISVRSSDQHKPHRHITVIGKSCDVAIDEVLSIYKQHPQYSDGFSHLLNPYYLFF